MANISALADQLRTTLSDLAARCEAATGSDRGLDLHIEAAVNPEYEDLDEDHTRWFIKYGGHPKYTASLDAAMTLMPEGWVVRLSADAEGADVLLFDDRRQDDAEGVAATPALALCAAALRARVAQ